MAHMIPVAEHFAAYHVETNAGTEIVPEEVCGVIDTDDDRDENEYDLLRDYIEGSRVESVERREGWYARLSAPGYLDATEWHGPYDTAELALNAVKEMFDVDDNGDDINDPLDDTYVGPDDFEGSP